MEFYVPAIQEWENDNQFSRVLFDRLNLLSENLAVVSNMALNWVISLKSLTVLGDLPQFDGRVFRTKVVKKGLVVVLPTAGEVCVY